MAGATSGAGTTYLQEHLISPGFLVGFNCVTQSLVFCVMFCRSLIVLLSFLFYLLYCLSFDLRLLIAHLYLQTFLVSVSYIFFYFPFLKQMVFSWYSVKVPVNTMNPNSLIHMYFCFHWCLWFTYNYVSM